MAYMDVKAHLTVAESVKDDEYHFRWDLCVTLVHYKGYTNLVSHYIFHYQRIQKYPTGICDMASN